MVRKPRQAVTIKHVAAEAGVSLQTVSRVINSEPNVRVVVQDRVKAAIRKLGYVPSLAARRMGGSRSYLILALNDRDATIEAWASGQGTDWIDQMLYGGMLKCAEAGYRMIFELIDTHSAHVGREVAAALSSLRPDGVILTPPHSDNPAITALLVDQGVPFARLGSDAAGAGFAIAMDERTAAGTATNHLLDLGHRRIGFIVGSHDYALSGARLEGYRRALTARGLPDGDDLVVDSDFGFESGLAAMRTLLQLSEPVTAVIASSDQVALAVLRMAGERELAVPSDLSVISFYDTPVVRHSVPPMTAIVQPIAAMTARAADLLIRLKSGADTLPPTHVLPFEFVVRASTGPRGE